MTKLTPSEIALQQVDALAAAAAEFSKNYGGIVVEKMEVESHQLLNWIHFLQSHKTGVANELLEGAICSAREATACVALGLVRPSIFSIRMHIDLLFAWLYFKDHRIEWETLNSTGDGFKLKREILEYLTSNFPGFKTRLALLKDVISRTTEDPYRLLSAHIHAQSTVVIPVGQNLSEVVQGYQLALQCAPLWREVSEYVSDILVAVYAPKWTALPSAIQSSVELRLKSQNKHFERFFEGL